MTSARSETARVRGPSGDKRDRSQAQKDRSCAAQEPLLSMTVAAPRRIARGLRVTDSDRYWKAVSEPTIASRALSLGAGRSFPGGSWWRDGVSPGRPAEADLVAVRVPVGHLGHAVAVRLAPGGLDAPPGDPGNPVAEVVDERQQQGIPRPSGTLDDAGRPVPRNQNGDRSGILSPNASAAMRWRRQCSTCTDQPDLGWSALIGIALPVGIAPSAAACFSGWLCSESEAVRR